VINRPKNLKKEKNEQVLRGYLLAQQKAARTVMPDGNLSIEEFTKCCYQRKKYPIIFKIEFGSAIMVNDTPSHNAARLPANTVKNRTEEIVANDDNRVTINTGDINTDYINASFCYGLVPGQRYIVTQGPLESTVTDFWLMVWQEQCPGIVMLTKTFDYIRVMCVQYWPTSRREEQYGDLRVSVTQELCYASYIQRTIRLVKHGEQRDVIHFQFTEWPCYSNPFSGALLNFRRMVAAALDSSTSTGPPVIHCHDGGGRSGVFLLLDANIRLIQASQQVNIYSYLTKMRSQRAGLVATQDQYKLVYSLVEEFLICGDTVASMQDFITTHIRQNQGALEDQYEKDFATVNKIKPELSQGDFAGGHRVDNRNKNRSILVLPPDIHRPYITSFQGNDCTDYINAVFVDGYIRANDFVVTEWPLPNTVQNFWSMVYDHDIATIVVLDSPKPSTKYPTFWPELGKPRKYGPVFSVEQLKQAGEPDKDKQMVGLGCQQEQVDIIETQDSCLTVRLDISKKEVAPHRKTQALYVDDKQGKQFSSLTNLVVGVTAPAKRVRLFQLQHSPSGDDAASLVSVLGSARRWRDLESPDSPMLVVSLDGAEKAGVYCVGSHCWDQLVRDKEVDLLHAVRSVRVSRPQLVSSLQEYKLCSELIFKILTK
jgi:protein tyrosine phosphatase